MRKRKPTILPAGFGKRHEIQPVDPRALVAFQALLEGELQRLTYWHHDEDFAAFMDAVLDPLQPEDFQ